MRETFMPKFEVLPKSEPIQLVSDRKGYVADLYRELLRLKAERPDDRMVIKFASQGAASGAVKKMAGWAAEDGYELMQEVVHASDGKRGLHLQDAGE